MYFFAHLNNVVHSLSIVFFNRLLRETQLSKATEKIRDFISRLFRISSMTVIKYLQKLDNSVIDIITILIIKKI